MSDPQNTFFSNSNMNSSGCAPVKSRPSWHIPSSPPACSRRNRRKSSNTSFDITASLAEMDTMYDACFSSWVRTESNLSTICAYLHRLSTEFDAAQVAKVVQFVSSEWKIESIAWLVRCVGGEDCFGNGKSGCKGCNESWAYSEDRLTPTTQVDNCCHHHRQVQNAKKRKLNHTIPTSGVHTTTSNHQNNIHSWTHSKQLTVILDHLINSSTPHPQLKCVNHLAKFLLLLLRSIPCSIIRHQVIEKLTKTWSFGHLSGVIWMIEDLDRIVYAKLKEHCYRLYGNQSLVQPVFDMNWKISRVRQWGAAQSDGPSTEPEQKCTGERTVPDAFETKDINGSCEGTLTGKRRASLYMK